MTVRLFIAVIIGWLCFGCKARTVYVPVANLQKEYIDKWHRDSVYLHDSVVTILKGDTVFREKYRYRYRDRWLRDSIICIDSIRVPFPVIEQVEVNRINSLQHFQIWCGRILLILLLGYFGILLLKRFK